MSVPPAWMVQAPLSGSNDWVPAGLGLPMSAQLHGAGQATGGAGAGGPPGSATPGQVAVLPLAASRRSPRGRPAGWRRG